MVRPVSSVVPGWRPASSARRTVPKVAVARGREGPFADAVVDGGLERPPACETVLAGDEQLGVGQLCGGILDAHFLEALLGFVPEMLEDNLPSFAGHSSAVCPASANLGREVRLC